MIIKTLCNLNFHNWKNVFIGCPIGFAGIFYGKSCTRCGKLTKKYIHSLTRPKNVPIDVHVVSNLIPISDMSNKELQFYLLNLNNKDNVNDNER